MMKIIYFFSTLDAEHCSCHSCGFFHEETTENWMEMVQSIVVYVKYKALSMSVLECPVDRLHWLILFEWKLVDWNEHPRTIHQPSKDGWRTPMDWLWMGGVKITPLTPPQKRTICQLSTDGLLMVVWPIMDTHWCSWTIVDNIAKSVDWSINCQQMVME